MAQTYSKKARRRSHFPALRVPPATGISASCVMFQKKKAPAKQAPERITEKREKNTRRKTRKGGRGIVEGVIGNNEFKSIGAARRANTVPARWRQPGFRNRHPSRGDSHRASRDSPAKNLTIRQTRPRKFQATALDSAATTDWLFSWAIPSRASLSGDRPGEAKFLARSYPSVASEFRILDHSRDAGSSGSIPAAP